MKEREVGEVGIGEVSYSANPGVDSSSEVLLVVHSADDDGLEVDGIHVEREKGALDTKDVPPRHLIAARHGVETLATDDAVPGLKLRGRENIVVYCITNTWTLVLYEHSMCTSNIPYIENTNTYMYSCIVQAICHTCRLGILLPFITE